MSLISCFSPSTYLTLDSGPSSWLLEPLIPRGGSSIIWAPGKSGKALALDTPIPTPTGWRPLGDIVVGDQVFGAHGHPIRVAATSPIILDHACFRLTFSDGTSIVADADHQWQVFDTRCETHCWPLTRTTRELAERPFVGRRATAARWRISLAEPVNFAPAPPLPIHPYLLGAWLGDGNSHQGSITMTERGIRRSIYDLGEGWRCRRVGRTAALYSICHANDRPGYHEFSRRLRLLNVLNNKHIPETYLRASRADRLALLQGLMDTDGGISRGHLTETAEFYNTNAILAAQVADLARSLGAKVSVHEKPAMLYGAQHGTCYTCQIRAPFICFRMIRKAKQQRLCRYERYHSIVAIDPVPSVPVKCLVVDDPRHLFLAGHGYTVTHNSTWALQIAVALARHDPFLGLRTHAQAKTLYLQIDNPRTLWKDRLALLDLGEDLDQWIRVVDKESAPFPFNIRLPEHAMALQALVAAEQPDLVIIDTLRESYRGDENDSDTLQQVMSTFTAVCRPAALLYVHHSKKPPTDGLAASHMDAGRGSSYISGAVDTIISLRASRPTVDKSTGELVTKGVLTFKGRAVSETDIKIVQDQSQFLWHLPEIVADPFKAALDLILEDPTYPTDKDRAQVLSDRFGKSLNACQLALSRARKLL